MSKDLTLKDTEKSGIPKPPQTMQPVYYAIDLAPPASFDSQIFTETEHCQRGPEKKVTDFINGWGKDENEDWERARFVKK